jgi:hypothetical protein
MKNIILKGSVTIFVMIMLGLIIGFFLMGFQQPALVFFKETVAGDDITTSDFDMNAFLTGIKDAVLSPFGLGLIGVMTLFSLVSVFSGGTVGVGSFISFFIPIFILFAVANVFFFPIVGYMQAEGMANLHPLDLIVAVVFNVLLMLTVIEFISGRN